jgi:hypothetical protein
VLSKASSSFFFFFFSFFFFIAKMPSWLRHFLAYFWLQD